MRLGAVGLAAATGVAAWVEYALLRRAVRRRLTRTTLAGGQLGRLLLASVLAGACAALARPVVTELPVFLAGMLAAAVMAVAYAAAALALRVSEVSAVLAGLARVLRLPGRTGR